MRNLKKFLALVLAMMMVFSLMLTVNAAGPKDIAGNPYEEAIRTLYNYGVVQGTNAAGDFGPNLTFTRGQLAGIAYKIATGDVDEKYVAQNAEYAIEFEDVKATDWFAGYVGFCANYGIIKGDGAGHFFPYNEVTGYEAAALLLKLVGWGANGEFEGTDWRKNVGSTGIQTGVTTGLAVGTDLNKTFNRAQVAQIAYKAAFQTERVQYAGNNVYTPLGKNLINEEYVARTTDMWGAPANEYYASFTWPIGYDVTTVNLVADEPELETWMPVSQAAVVTAAGSETVDVYTNGKGANNLETGVKIDKTATTTSATTAMGGYGRWTRVYKGIVVYVDTFLSNVGLGVTTYYNEYDPAGDTSGPPTTAGTGPIDGHVTGANDAPNAATGKGHSDGGAASLVSWKDGVTPTAGKIASYAQVNNYPAKSAFDNDSQIDGGARVEAYPVTSLNITVRGIELDTAGNVVGVEASNGQIYFYNCTYTYDGYDPDGDGVAANDAARLYYTDINTTRTIYLDANGFIVGIEVDDVDNTSQVGVVVGYNYGMIEPGKYYGQVTVLKHSGQQETVKFIDIDASGTTIALNDSTADQQPYDDDKEAYEDAALLMGHLISWKPDNASATASPKYPGYQLITLDDTNGATQAITGDKIEVGDADAIKTDVSKLLNDDTLFFVVNYQMKNSENGYVFTTYSRYTGFQSLPGDLSVDNSNAIVEGTNPNKMASDNGSASTLDIEYFAGATWANVVLIINASKVRTNVVEPVKQYAFMVDPNKFVTVRDNQYEYRAIMNGRANQPFLVTYDARQEVQNTGLYTYDERTNDGWADVDYRDDLMFTGGNWDYTAGVLSGDATPLNATYYYTVAKTGCNVYIVDPQTGAIESQTTAAAWDDAKYSGCDIWFQLNQYGYINTIYVMNTGIGVEGNIASPIGAEVTIDALPTAVDKLTTIGSIMDSITATATKYKIINVQVQKLARDGGSTWTYCSRGETVNDETYAYRVEITFAAEKNVNTGTPRTDYYFDATSDVAAPLTATNSIVLSYTRDVMVVGVLVSVTP